MIGNFSLKNFSLKFYTNSYPSINRLYNNADLDIQVTRYFPPYSCAKEWEN